MPAPRPPALHHRARASAPSEGSQSLVTIRYASRARKIIAGYRESRGTQRGVGAVPQRPLVGVGLGVGRARLGRG